jgi:hypothetical protein
MSDDYGKRMGLALRAVRQMHSDTSKLLQDCDGTIGKGRPSVFGKTVTADLTYQINALQWMAEGVYRYYVVEPPGRVEGLCACFICANGHEDFDQPILVVGQIAYSVADGQSLRDVCDAWDLWYAFLNWNEDRRLGEVLWPVPESDGRIEAVKVIGVPLYTVKGIQMVNDLMEQVRSAIRP